MNESEVTGMKRNTIIKVCCVIWVICAVLTFCLYYTDAFSRPDYRNDDGFFMGNAISFGQTLPWISTRWFSLAGLVGLSYLLSLIISGLLIVFSVFVFLGAKKIFKIKIIKTTVKVIIIFLCLFYTFTLTISIIATVQMYATFALYMFAEILTLTALILALIIGRRTKAL